jgi:Spy/CpxP family protein refolding chaperone
MKRRLAILLIVFSSALAYAHDGSDNRVAYNDTPTQARRAPQKRTAQTPTPPTPKPPKPPKTPTPPQPPQPPQPPKHKITINGTSIDLAGIEGLVRGQLDGVREMIKTNPHIPPQTRDKILARLDKVRASVDKRLAKIKTKGFDDIGEELSQMGEEIGQALEGLDDELEVLGDQLGKDLSKKFKKKNFKFDFGHKDKGKHDHDDNDNDNDNDNDDDDDDDVGSIPMTPDLQDTDSDGMRDAVNDLKGLAVTSAQKEQIAKIRSISDKEVAAARANLEALSQKLETALGNAKTSDDEIRRLVDDISRQEAAIRKARLVAWHSARRVLDESQRKRIEAAAAKHKPK